MYACLQNKEVEMNYRIKIILNDGGLMNEHCESYNLNDKYISLERVENGATLVIVPLCNIKYISINWIKEVV
jgi:hypothetical protein